MTLNSPQIEINTNPIELEILVTPQIIVGGSTSLNQLSDVTKGNVQASNLATIRVLADINQDGNYIEVDWTPSGGSGGGTVDSVNGEIGAVVLTTDDINDTATNRYTNDTDIARLVNTSGTNTGDETNATVKTKYEANTNTNALTDTLLSKLNGIENGATADQTDTEIKVAYENNANTNAFTDAEKTKLASLEESLFLGQFTSLANLQTAHTSPAIGSFAYVDQGVGVDTIKYLWDSTDNQYVTGGVSGSETPASIKTKYESNPDTNAFTDAEQSKLAGIEANATADQTDAEIKTAYENNSNTNAFTDSEQTKLSQITNTGSGQIITTTERNTIADNAADIATNTTNISSNTGNINTNSTNIATNTSNISSNTSNINTNTTSITALKTDCITGLIPTVEDRNYIFSFDTKFAFTIVNLSIQTESGSCTASVQINGTNVTGLSGIAVSTTITNATATGANSVAVGDNTSILISGNSSAEYLSFSVEILRP